MERVAVYRNRLVAGLLIVLSTQALRMVLPLITRSVVNDVIPTADFALMWKLGGLLVGITAVRATMLYTRGIIFERISQNVICDLRTELYSKFQAQSHTFYDKHKIGEIMSRMTGDMEGVRNFVLTFCMTMGEQFFAFTFACVSMGMISWKLTLATLSVCVPLSIIAAVFNKRIRPMHAAVREQNAVLNTRAQENIAGIRIVKAFAREDYESERFREDNEKALELNLKATFTWSDFNPVMDILGSLGAPVVLLVGGIMVSQGTLDLGSLVAALGYIWMMVNPMRMLAHFVNVIAQGLSSAEKLFYYLDLGSTVKSPENAVSPRRGDGGSSVEFDDVTFSYGDSVVLKNVSFEARPGETVAVMGATGTGKTTIAGLMARFYDVRSGRVLIDGADVRQFSLPALRSRVGFVMQDTFLFSDSIEENVAFAHPGQDKTEVEEACEVAQAGEFIDHLPQKWETIVGERGLGLSGGQKQRVSIARALAAKPSVLILDDATSAVDMETEALIQEGLRKRAGKATTIIIAHRISSVIHADQIIVLDKGGIAERGTHRQLLEKDGLYKRMFLDQVRDFASVNHPAKSADLAGAPVKEAE
jgi:ATP-binding cassette subfamily B protein